MISVRNPIITCLLRQEDLNYVPIQDNLRLQILPSMHYLPNCQRHQGAAFIRDQQIFVVWADSVDGVEIRANTYMDQIIQVFSKGFSEPGDKFIKQEVFVKEVPLESEESSVKSADIEGDTQVSSRRPVLIQALLTAATLALVIAALGSGWRQIVIEVATDNQYIRLAFIIVVPFQIWLALFFMQSIAGCIAQLIGPTNQMRMNTKYYSGQKSKPISRRILPHMTIQCPVYKESLHETIIPTMESIQDAIRTYEMQGGTANIFVNEDGMQVISQEEAELRRQYYAEQRIGWVSRPKHKEPPKRKGIFSRSNQTPALTEGEEYFIRAGKFKKASNMNFALAVSVRVEEKLAAVPRHVDWTQHDEDLEYQRCLAEVVTEDQGRTKAEGDIRIGEYILLVDSDTRVPNDCFLDAVSELELSPQVAVLQYNSGVTNVSNSFFEHGITFFTQLIYTAIKYAVSNGDVAPFVGHNAVLRWSAIQEIAYEKDGVEKYWSEETVSEDFDMALRLQIRGYLVRFASYTMDGFKEGVSLTVYDELARWEKYAYGCSELIFHPLRYWFTRGPFTPLFRMFMGSNMPLPSKLTIMAYVGTYFAIASAWILTLANYFLVGWLNGHLDHYYIDSFRIYFAIVIVFNGLGNLALAALRVRNDEQSLLPALIGNFKWILLLTVFLGGISLHVSQAILCHLFGINIEWGATAKEIVDIPFSEEMSKVLKRFWKCFTFCIICAGGMAYMAMGAPALWRINFFTAIWPLSTVIFAHFFLPIALNPGLMRFKW